VELPKELDDFSFAYMSKGQVKGEIKQSPEDFRVNEIDRNGRVVDENYIPYESEGQFCVFVLRKRDIPPIWQ
jgi:tRNA(Glu) U13 pseudouridine synthase TruD